MFDPSFTAQLSALGSTWLPVLVDTAIKGSAVLVVACIVGLFVRRASAATRHMVWFLAMVSLLAMPGLFINGRRREARYSEGRLVPGE
jgi:hypothetical protein